MSMRQLHGCRRYMVLEVNKSFIWANGLGLVLECSISSQALQSQMQITYLLGLSSKVLEGGERVFGRHIYSLLSLPPWQFCIIFYTDGFCVVFTLCCFLTSS